MRSSSAFSVSLERFLVVFWVGGLWVTGYVVAPSLFATLDDRALAGTLAGVMFTRMAWLGLGCGTWLLLLGRSRFRPHTVWIIAGMLVLIAVGQFILHPMISELRSTGLAEGTPGYRRFAMLHGISSFLFLITSILGAVLAIRDR